MPPDLRKQLARVLIESGEAPQSVLFGGERSKTADRDALARALAMQKSGANRDQIWADTGWFQNDGRWRYEINDEKAKAADPTPGKVAPMSRIMDHPDLYQAYPEIGRFGVLATQTDGDVQGGFARQTVPFFLNQNLTADGIRHIGIHELQHAIDHIEGTMKGGSGAASDMAAYLAHPDEMIANAAASRMNLTAEERRQRPPWLDISNPAADDDLWRANKHRYFKRRP